MTIIAVTGSTRCGTTLLMRMLNAGGIPAYAENLVSFETPRIFDLPADSSWLSECEGHAVKLLEPLYLLPLPRLEWRFILMRRNPREQARSQIKFMNMLGTPVPDSALEPLIASLRADLPKMRKTLGRYGPVLDVSFEEVLERPLETAYRVEKFVGKRNALDTNAMAAQVIARSADCYPGLLEMVLT